MSHQSQLEKSKYRNWVRGGLAYRYLKEGIEGFADDVVQKEHTRIVGAVNNTSGKACDQCDLNTLKPIHTHVADQSTGRKTCPRGQFNCNCLYPRKKPCPNKVCDDIMEEILKSHGSTPPTPNWKNTDVQKWYTSPLEIAKCFINAPGYLDKTSAADIDINGLLHVFINNINLHTHLSCNMTGTNIFMKCRETRNKLFHSPEMELEDTKLTECIDDIIAILEDPKELAVTADAQQAVSKLKQLKHENFIITIHNEAEVCRDALAYITNKTVELNQMIQEAKDDIDRKHGDASKAIEDKLQTDLQDVLKDNSDINFLKQSVESLAQRINCLEEDNSQIKMRLLELDQSIDSLKAVKYLQMEKLKYVEEKQALQDGLVILYQRHYVKTSLSPLKLQENDINIEEVYIEPEMVVVKADKWQNFNNKSEIFKRILRSINEKHVTFQSICQENKAIYIVGDVGAGKSSFCKMMIQDWCKAAKSPNESVSREGSDKPRTLEMADDSNANRTSTIAEKSSASSSDSDMSDKKSVNSVEHVMTKFEFLFYIQLEKTTKYCKIIDMIQEICTAESLASTELVKRVFEQDSERCLIIIDGLDEWRPDNKDTIDDNMSHESKGLPLKQDIRNATVVTLSRPSAIGMLNIKSSEIDQKVELKGIRWSSIHKFIQKYMSKLNKSQMSSDDLMRKIEKSELKHLENTPLLLQQLVWLYCNTPDPNFDKSVSDIYSHLVNIMCRWFDTKGKESKERGKGNQYEQKTSPKHHNTTEESKSRCSDRGKQYEEIKLPKLLDRFPKCKEHKSLLIPLARVAFEFFTSKSGKGFLSRSHVEDYGISEKGVSKLIDFGILVEKKCYDQTYDDTFLSFIHKSYLEFFAAVYASYHFDDRLSGDKNSAVITELFPNVKTAADILQLSNVLKMICGLCPFVITQVSLFISNIVKKDEKLIHIRQDDIGCLTHSFIIQIQLLTMSFLSIYDTNDKMINLSDICIDNQARMPAIRSIIPDNVISCSVNDGSNEEMLKWMTQLNHLQYLNMSFCYISHDQMTILCSFIQEAPLRCISLLDVRCQQQDCRGHSIDLSKLDHLQKLMIWLCDRIKISKFNTEHLEAIQLDTLDIGLLQNSRSLTELRLTLKYSRQADYVVHTLHQLKTLTLSRAYIDENAFTVTPEMRTLNNITLYNVEMSLETWRTFVDSLLTLQQAVQVDTIFDLKDLKIGNYLNYLEKTKYVEGKESMFEVIEDWRAISLYSSMDFHFYFRTRKQ